MVSSPSSERLAQLRAFDETKLGVKGLVDAGVTTIPSIFINQPNDHPSSKTCTSSTINIPTIDLTRVETDPDERKDTIKRVREAAETWGFFQVVNHGIPAEVLEEMLGCVKRFFEDDDEVKKGYYTRDFTNKRVVYNANFDLYSSPSANWRDTISCFMAPTPPNPEDLPASCRVIVKEYSDQVMKLGTTLFELLSEGLGLKPSHLNEIGCSEGLQVLMHYYPACPQPDLTMGASKHADQGFLTVLLRDHIGGLQILQHDQWFDVPATPGALLINTADILQLITNDRFKSVTHRVKLGNNETPRISVACFFSTGYQRQSTARVFGPIKELLSDSDPARYRETTVHEFANYVKGKGLGGRSYLEHFRI